MLCTCCHGQHFVIRSGQLMPCPECGGVGEVHCCDGLTAQPDFSSCGSEVARTTEWSPEAVGASHS
jgi:hypothetical protein